MADRNPGALKLKVEPATAEALAPYGVLLASDPAIAPLPISFYDGKVIVRKPGLFESESQPDITVCRLDKRPLAIDYLERHPRHTQAFIPLGGKPFVAVFAPPDPADLPQLDKLRAFRFDGSGGFMMHKGVWHEFPFALEDGTDIIVILSQDTNKGLHDDNVIAGEAHGPDIDKKNLVARTGMRIEISL